MQKKNSRDDAHARIALILKAAKKKMFKHSRQGVNLRVVMDRFCSEVAAEFESMIPHRRADNDDALWDAIERGDDEKVLDIVFPETEQPDHVDATLPSGEVVELYGDAVDIEREAQGYGDNDRKVLRALHELLNNPKTPQELHEACAEFVCEQSNKTDFHQPIILAAILETVTPEETRGAVCAAYAAREAQSAATP